jgi:hypothetical protein
MELEAEKPVLAQTPLDDRALVLVGGVEPAEWNDPRVALVQLEVEPVYRLGLVVGESDRRD